MGKFKVGDEVTIVGNKFNHKFEIGDVVEIVWINPHRYYVKDYSKVLKAPILKNLAVL